MKPNKKLINALRDVAHDVTNDPSIWSWIHTDSCNCGLLAQKLGISSSIIELSNIGYWDDLEDEYRCNLTNTLLNDVMNILQENGIEEGDLAYIEHGVNLNGTAKDLSNFFLELADKLETQLLNQRTKQAQSVSVSV